MQLAAALLAHAFGAAAILLGFLRLPDEEIRPMAELAPQEG